VKDSPLSDRAPAPAEVGLVALNGPDEGAAIALLQGELTIGRSAPADVIIDSRLVSKVHARLRRAGDRLAIDDLKSPNGTFVNGTRVQTSQALRDGDLVSIAGIRQYRVRIALPVQRVTAPRPVEETLVTAPRQSEETLVQPRDVTVILWGPGGDFTLRAGSHVVGRDKGMAVALDDRQISRTHAVITVAGFRVTVEDRDSVNGTMVNGELVKSPRPLHSGDRIRFGDLEFTVTIKMGL
jgi:pSer/pThr/pTyr-binding forkhead associated (FHA) protein